MGATFIRLLFKTDLKASNDVRIAACVRYEFQDSVFKYISYIKDCGTRIPHIMFDSQIEGQAAPGRDRNHAAGDRAMTERGKPKLISGQRPDIGVIGDTEGISWR